MPTTTRRCAAHGLSSTLHRRIARLRIVQRARPDFLQRPATHGRAHPTRRSAVPSRVRPETCLAAKARATVPPTVKHLVRTRHIIRTSCCGTFRQGRRPCRQLQGLRNVSLRGTRPHEPLRSRAHAEEPGEASGAAPEGPVAGSTRRAVAPRRPSGLCRPAQAIEMPNAPVRTRTRNSGIGIRRYVQFNYRSRKGCAGSARPGLHHQY